ncbi:MAG: DHH family phosphoesterase [Pseudomonadota bacterium]
MVDIAQFNPQIESLGIALSSAQRILITAPGAADGDSIGAQLALQRMLKHRFPEKKVFVVNDELLPPRYQFLPDAESVYTPETLSESKEKPEFDIAFVVDGGIDRAGRVKAWFDKTPTTVFIDHHAISCEYPYSLKLVDPLASATTELVYHLSQTPLFRTPIEPLFAQQIYLGLVFDTGFFRHSNTTPEAMTLAAELLKTGFDFTRVGERGMLERSLGSLRLMADTLTQAKTAANGKIIWSALSQSMLRKYDAIPDDREGIIDHLFLTHGVEVALLLFELGDSEVKLSLRSQGRVDVAKFARSLTVRGGGHSKAAGALLQMPIEQAASMVLEKLSVAVSHF